MEQFWFLVETNSLVKELEFEKHLVKELAEQENKVEVFTLVQQREPSARYNEVSGDVYEQRPTHIA